MRRIILLMFIALGNLLESIRKPKVKEVFFPSLPFNRRLLLWYAGRFVKPDSRVEPAERIRKVDELRRKGTPLTFICNHLTYADSHIIETLFVRFGMKDLADHIVHIAGQKTFQLSRRVMTRSLNTVRVYQPKASVDGTIKKKMNTRALKWAARLKRRGYSLLVFPEGTRTRLLRHFNLHAANPKTTVYFRDSYVVPLALMGSEKIMPVGSVLQKPATVVLRIGDPILHREMEERFRQEQPQKTEREMRQSLMLTYMEEVNTLLDPGYRYVKTSADQPPGM